MISLLADGRELSSSRKRFERQEIESSSGAHEIAHGPAQHSERDQLGDYFEPAG